MSARITRAVAAGSFLAVTCLLPGLSWAQTTPPGTRPAQPTAGKGSLDSHFIAEAAEGGMKEVGGKTQKAVGDMQEDARKKRDAERRDADRRI